ncbi:hypothetical protein D1007_34321 [Hordeum vulgare]|nr:hypothetical protein D1007_34321 [Hordeum vulgare]
MTDELRNFLELNQPKMKEGKKDKFRVSVMEPKVGSHIVEATGILSESNDYIQEPLCAMRQHFDQFIDELKCSVVYALNTRSFTCSGLVKADDAMDKNTI